MKTVLVTLSVAAAVALAAAALVVYGGLYDISATSGHTQLVHSLLETTMRRSVQLRSRDIAVPALERPDRIARGAACYRDHCVLCHGGPAVPPGDVGMSLQPLPGPLIDAARRWRPAELYWILRHGIKMSGMPAWQFRLGDEDLWSVVAFLDRLPELSPADYAGHTAAAGAPPCVTGESRAATMPRPTTPAELRQQARVVLQQYACTACHTIPGVVGSQPQVGPPLEGIARRSLLAGRLPNTEDNLVRWIRAPRSIDPNSAMPELGVSEEHARLMAAYLATLR